MNLKNEHCQFVAHRGLAYYAPENTLEAFIGAAKLKFYAMECDIHVTKDHQFVVFHDFTLERLTNGVGFIKDYTLSELKQFNIISGNHIHDFQNVKIPSLKEFLDVCLKYHVVPVIEIKAVLDITDLDQLCDLLEQAHLIDKAIVISFELNYLIYLRDKSHPLNIQFLVEEISEATLESCRSYHFDIDAYYGKVTRIHVNRCHQLGIKVNVWTIDEEKIALNFMKQGVDFITTNRLVDESQQALRFV